MKSYSQHLKSTQSFGEIQNKDYRPTMRSSAVFPLLHKPNRLTSIYTFMGYWLQKRKIPLVTVLITLRNKDGEKISVQSIEVSDVRSFEISSADLLIDPNMEFTGSAEIEIFSAVDMVFPYPAITFALKGLNGLTFVHTCGRIYNDFDDLNANTEQEVKETGFDLYIGKDYTPFFSFVNGPIEIKNESIELEYIDHNNKLVSETIKIESVPPFGLGWINLAQEGKILPSNKLVKSCVKVKHNFKGFFPRFVAGNVLRDFEDVSLTHSYYDTSSDNTIHAIWKNPNKEEFEDSVVAIPFDTDFSSIELAIYPNFSKSLTRLRFDLHTSSGKLVDSKKSDIELGSSNDKLTYVDLIDMFSEHIKSTPKGMVRMVLLGEGSVPARMKFGLNFHKPTSDTNLPSNICFNANVPNEKLLLKPGTFRWCTIFDAFSQKIYLHNSSFIKSGFNDAEISIKVYREIDAESLNWDILVPYNGTIDILEGQKKSVDEFLQGSTGWVTFTCSSPFVTGYYITDFGKGVIGADHFY
tara:strand:+ start:382 stop:1953 length:1572 start_codon:yes stop_codon:yes gene_type:complete